MDLTYAHGQLPLNETTSKQCNFSLVGGRSTGTYRFKTGFYELLRTMLAEFQRVTNAILSEFPCAHVFIDDILVISKGTKIEYIALVEKILSKLKENMALKLEKCQFAKNECEWLGHRITKLGIMPMVRKTDLIDKLAARERYCS